MDTQVMKETFPQLSSPSYLLAKKARTEKLQNGMVTVVCPKCGQIPEVRIAGNNERILVKCKCGYIMDGEIYF